MARSRNIKPAIMDNEDLAALSPLHRLLFVYLWMLADREGRLEDRPRRIAAQALPYDREADVDAMLRDLALAGFITRYAAAGVECIQVLNFAKHQTPHVREAASALPMHEPSTTKVVPKHCPGDASAQPRSPDSLIPDSLIPDTGFLIDAAEADVSPAPAARAATRGQRLSLDWQLPRAWSEWALAEYPQWTPDKARLEADKFRDHWVGKTGKDATKNDWQATWRNWCRSDLAHRDDRKAGAAGKHTDFESKNYREGVTEDGSLV